MNPLFLRLYCKAATTQPGLLASPLPGLTRIVEAVLKDIDVRARQVLRADPCQEVMRPVCQALAIAMRQHGRAFLTRPEATEIANAALPDLNRGEYARTPLAVVISEGLLAEDFVIDGTPQQLIPVVRFAFERIGDHLAAGALLAEASHHGEVSPDDVLDGLADALSTFDTAPYDYSADYRLRSMLEALTVVLPERLPRELPDLIAAGPRYRLLYVTDHLLERPEEGLYPYADLLISVDSVLIRRADLPVIQQWPGSQPLDGLALEVSITDAIFLGEWPDGPSYLANCDPGFRPRTWQEAEGTDSIGLGVPAIVATERYCWEGSIYDCSLPGTVNIHLLTPAAARLFPGIRQRDRIARSAEGTLIHLDPHPAPDADGTLLVNEQLLADALVREDLVLLQIIQQSKRVFLAMGDSRFAGETHSTRLIGTVGEEVLLDITRGQTLPARLY